jgi:hypothetical protein
MQFRGSSQFFPEKMGGNSPDIDAILGGTSPDMGGISPELRLGFVAVVGLEGAGKEKSKKKREKIRFAPKIQINA